MERQYIVVGIRHNPGKKDYIWTSSYANGQAQKFNLEEAERKADSVNSDASKAIYGAKPVMITS